MIVPAGAGDAAGFPDAAYATAGAKVVTGAPQPADLLFGIGPLRAADLAGAAAVIALLDPLVDPDNVAAIAASGATAFALEMLPRTTLAQAMDVLSSQATAAGYEAVLLAARTLPRFFPMMTTAAGTIRPATILVLGAGVAGLQAIATAKRLGAVVFGYDIRPAARDEIESLGARFVGGPVAAAAEGGGGYAAEVDEATRAAEQQALAAAVAAADVIITTAQVPGRRGSVPRYRRHGRHHEAGFGADRRGRRLGRQLRTHRTGPGGDPGRGNHPRTDRPGVGDRRKRSETFSRNVVTLFDHVVQKGGLTPSRPTISSDGSASKPPFCTTWSKSVTTLRLNISEAFPAVADARSVGPRMVTPPRITTWSGAVSSQLPPEAAATSISTEPGFMVATMSAVTRTGARRPGTCAVVMITSAAATAAASACCWAARVASSTSAA